MTIVFESLKRLCSSRALYVISVLSDNLSRPVLPARGSGLSEMNSRGRGLAASQVYPADGNVSAEDVEVRAHEGALLKQCIEAEWCSESSASLPDSRVFSWWVSVQNGPKQLSAQASHTDVEAPCAWFNGAVLFVSQPLPWKGINFWMLSAASDRSVIIWLLIIGTNWGPRDWKRICLCRNEPQREWLNRQ